MAKQGWNRDDPQLMWDGEKCQSREKNKCVTLCDILFHHCFSFLNLSEANNFFTFTIQRQYSMLAKNMWCEHRLPTSVISSVRWGSWRPGAVAHACNLSTWGGLGRWITRSRDQDHPGQHSETPSLLKMQKLSGRGGVRLYSQLLGRLRPENCFNLGGGGCSEPRSCHCTPDWWQSKTLSKK